MIFFFSSPEFSTTCWAAEGKNLWSYLFPNVYFLSGVPEVWAPVKSERPRVSRSDPASAFVLPMSSATNWLALTGSSWPSCHRRSCQARFCGQCHLSSPAVCSTSLRRKQREVGASPLWAFGFAVTFQCAVMRATWLRSPENTVQWWIPCFLPQHLFEPLVKEKIKKSLLIFMIMILKQNCLCSVP